MRQRCALLAILSLAAVLRFTGLSWGLRHTPDPEETLFVEPVARMILRGDLDHRFYEYPGLFFYMLLPAVSVAAPRHPPPPAAYLAARALVAALGVVSVGLVFRLASRLAGPAAGLSAALFLAVAPMEVETAHQVRPDVALETLVLLFLLSLGRLGENPRGDALSGAALGAATGLKFTGVLLAPSYVLARVLAPGPRLTRMFLAAAVSILVWLATTPAAVLRTERFLAGAMVQLSYHYEHRGRERSRGEVVRYYLYKTGDGLGLGVCGLAAVGLVLAARDPRRWVPYVAWPVVLLAVLSTAQARYGRLALSSYCVLCALAGGAIAQVAGRRPRAGALLALAAATGPFFASVQFVRAAAGPSTLDDVADWTRLNLPKGARVLSGVDSLILDRRRFQAVPAKRQARENALAARHSDYLVWRADQPVPVPGCVTLHAAEPLLPYSGTRILVLAVPEAEKRAYSPVPLAGARTSASANAERLAAVVSGRSDASWQTPGPQTPNDFVEVVLAEPVFAGRVTLGLGRHARLAGRSLRLLGTEDGREWRAIRAIAGPPPGPERLAGRRPGSQVLVFEPARLRGIRISPGERGRSPWAFVAIRLESPRRPQGGTQGGTLTAAPEGG